MKEKHFPLYVNGMYVHSPHYRPHYFPAGPSSLPERDSQTPASLGLGLYSFIQDGCPESAEILEAAVAGAYQTFQQCLGGFFPLNERLDFLKRLADKLLAGHDNVARLLSQEIGKPIDLARLEVTRAIKTIEWTVAEAMHFFAPDGINTAAHSTHARLGFIQKKPRGPLLAITPFNFPLNLAIHKFAPAIAAGMPVLLKPSDKSVISSLLIGDLCQAAELPAGFLSVIAADNKSTEKLVLDSRIKHVSFTGSAPVGWHLKSLNARIPFTLELGGNAPVFVDANADLELAAPSILKGAFSYAGQVCISVQNIHVHEKIYSAFKEALKNAQNSVKWGSPQIEGTLSGPVIDQSNFERLKNLEAGLQKSGAHVAWEANAGTFLSSSSHPQGHYLVPRIYENIPDNHALNSDEIFGPFAGLQKVQSVEHWQQKVNAQKSRLHAGIFTKDLATALECATKLKFGGVIINQVPTTRLESMPYGGEGDAGFGREGPRSTLKDYCYEQSVVIF